MSVCRPPTNGEAHATSESQKGLVVDLEAGTGGDPLIQPLPDADFLTLRLYNRRQDKAASQVRVAPESGSCSLFGFSLTWTWTKASV